MEDFFGHHQRLLRQLKDFHTGSVNSSFEIIRQRPSNGIAPQNRHFSLWDFNVLPRSVHFEERWLRGRNSVVYFLVRKERIPIYDFAIFRRIFREFPKSVVWKTTEFGLFFLLDNNEK